MAVVPSLLLPRLLSRMIAHDRSSKRPRQPTQPQHPPRSRLQCPKNHPKYSTNRHQTPAGSCPAPSLWLRLQPSLSALRSLPALQVPRPQGPRRTKPSWSPDCHPVLHLRCTQPPRRPSREPAARRPRAFLVDSSDPSPMSSDVFHCVSRFSRFVAEFARVLAHTVVTLPRTVIHRQRIECLSRNLRSGP